MPEHGAPLDVGAMLSPAMWLKSQEAWMVRAETLPSWRPGPTRQALLSFLEAAESVPIGERVACFDNDGTLWCERPRYIQLDFFLDALGGAIDGDPALRNRPEFAALLAEDQAAIAEIGLERIGLALAGLFEGVPPHTFCDRVREFMDRTVHSGLGLPLRSVVYQPMLELLEELRLRHFAITIVTGGGTEFVRAISDDLYGVSPEAVVGTLIEYEFGRTAGGVPWPRRTSRIVGGANEGPAKVINIQTQLGRRPILAGGNSGGDREMLEWACGGDGPGLALLIDHDDEHREFRYTSTPGTFEDSEPITDTAARLGWTTVSMANDWDVVFSERG